jgi:hypothetical protein
MDAIEQLLLLVRDEGFTGTVLPNSLVYLRWWSAGTLDAVTVRGEESTVAVRAYGVDLAHPEDTSGVRLDWKQHGPVVPVVTELLSLAQPAGVRVLVRVADQHAVSRSAAALWTP